MRRSLNAWPFAPPCLRSRRRTAASTSTVGARATLFRPAAAARVFEKTCGVLRLINNLATASLLAAATRGRKHVDLEDVDDAAFDQEHN
jgi:hypothetical protein